MKPKYFLTQLLSQITLVSLGMTNSQAEIIVDIFGTGSHLKHVDNFSSNEKALQRCQEFSKNLGYTADYCHHAYYEPLWEAGWLADNRSIFHLGVFYHGKCKSPETFNKTTGDCGLDEQKGLPPRELCIGNPINPAIGNKYQFEQDYINPKTGLTFSRTYNSIDTIWRHNFSTHLRFASGYISLVRADGHESFIKTSNSALISDRPEYGKLEKNSTGWTYIAPENNIYEFTNEGKLKKWITASHLEYNLSHTENSISIESNRGDRLIISSDNLGQPLTVDTNDTKIIYKYSSNQNLIKLTKTSKGTVNSKTKSFIYDDTRNPKHLTGIVDENGVRYATWTYDGQGRAISSEHANGAEKIVLAYNQDGSTTVTNEYGKKATYRFQVIHGIRKLVAVEGEPSPNCPASNSTFAYDERGLLKRRTDNNGNVTLYEYNERGLETSRREALGTPQERTILTQWHPRFYLPSQVEEPGRTIRYQYDEQGRQISQTFSTH